MALWYYSLLYKKSSLATQLSYKKYQKALMQNKNKNSHSKFINDLVCEGSEEKIQIATGNDSVEQQGI